MNDFRRARRRADVQRVLSLVSGNDEQLLSYEEVRRQLRAVETARQELAYIPLDAIVGSVGRYQDFTRQFLPVRESDEGRWVGVQRAMTGMAGVPPIEVYRLGDAYFVKDGNHRVSVARQLGADRIEAYVTEVATRVPFTPDMDQDDLIVASEFARFLEQTNLDELKPGADLRLTEPGSYPVLLEHISVHRYFMGIDLSRPVEWEEAVAHWYDAVYLPVARAIRQHDLLDGFPGRTEADLYLFLSEHRGKLQRDFGWTIGSPQLAEGLAPGRRFADLEERAELLTDSRAAPELLDSVLIVLAGDGTDEHVLRHGLALATREQAVVFGLLQPDGFEPAEPEVAAAARQRFEGACEAAGLEGQFAESQADSQKAAVREVQARAKYADLLVMPVDAKLTQALLRRSPKPLLLATAAEPGMKRPLLAYDGGAKANEALFTLAFLAVRHDLEPVILHVERRGSGVDLTPEAGRADGSDDDTLPRGKVEDASLTRAGEYLEKLGVKSRLVAARGPVAETILRIAEQHGCDAIFLGSHSRLRWLEEMLGGVLDQIIERTELPLLVT